MVRKRIVEWSDEERNFSEKWNEEKEKKQGDEVARESVLTKWRKQIRKVDSCNRHCIYSEKVMREESEVRK